MNKIFRYFLPAMLICVILSGCGSKDSDSGKEYVPGERTESEYSSEWAGLRYSLDSNMVMATDEEINSMMELGAEAMGDESKLQAELAKLTSVYEMMAVNMADQSNIIICTEKLTLSNISEEQYLDSVKSQMGDVYQGSSVTYSENGTREIAGLPFTEMSCTMDYSGVSMNQTYLVRKIGDRMYGIILSYMDASALETLLSGFSAY